MGEQPPVVLGGQRNTPMKFWTFQPQTGSTLKMANVYLQLLRHHPSQLVENAPFSVGEDGEEADEKTQLGGGGGVNPNYPRMALASTTAETGHQREGSIAAESRRHGGSEQIGLPCKAPRPPTARTIRGDAKVQPAEKSDVFQTLRAELSAGKIVTFPCVRGCCLSGGFFGRSFPTATHSQLVAWTPCCTNLFSLQCRQKTV